MGHENLQRTDQVKISSNRSFGWVFTAVFVVIGVLPWLGGHGLRSWALVVATAIAVIAGFAPDVLAPHNRAWSWFGLRLHAITSPIILGVMFFGVLTPFGLVMRACGKDLLRLKRDPAAASYWIERDPPGPAAESLKDQF